LASILNQVDGKTEENIMSFLEKQDSDLALSIKQKCLSLKTFLILMIKFQGNIAKCGQSTFIKRS